MKILLMLPESRYEKTYTSFLDPIEEDNVELEVIYTVGTTDKRVLNNDGDIIIARGITYTAVKTNMPDKKFVELQVTSYDIIATIQECGFTKKGDRIALFLLQKQHAIGTQIPSLFDCQVDVYYIEDEADITGAMEQVRRDNVDMVIGGGTSTLYAQSLGLPMLTVKSSPATILVGIKQGLELARAMNIERGRINLLQALLNTSRDAIIAVNHHGKIVAANHHSMLLLGLPKEEAWDTPHIIDNYLPSCDWESTLEHFGEKETLFPLHDKIYLISCKAVPKLHNIPLVLITLQDATEIQKKESKIRSELNKKGLVARYSFNTIKGDSPLLQKTISAARKYSLAKSNVLLTGESGTGKELFAHSIHNASNRKNQAFVAINCAALPENLLESELFGYVDGAFSGAAKGGKSGLFELAHKGTLFMDEVGELPLPLQAKLLRVLQEKEVRRVGGEAITSIDVRVISATNVDLEALVNQGKFRLDLYYRLNILAVDIPPLRQRPSDIPPAFTQWLHQIAMQYHQTTPILSSEAIAHIQAYPWPGNMRQMQNVCERLVVLDETGMVGIAELETAGVRLTTPPATVASLPKPMPTPEELGDLEQDELLRRLAQAHYSKADMATALGISRTTLWRKLKELNLSDV